MSKNKQKPSVSEDFWQTKKGSSREAEKFHQWRSTRTKFGLHPLPVQASIRKRWGKLGRTVQEVFTLKLILDLWIPPSPYLPPLALLPFSPGNETNCTCLVLDLFATWLLMYACTVWSRWRILSKEWHCRWHALTYGIANEAWEKIKQMS